MSKFSRSKTDPIQDYYYNTFKSMLQLNGKPNKQKLLKTLLLVDTATYLNLKLESILKEDDPQNPGFPGLTAKRQMLN